MIFLVWIVTSIFFVPLVLNYILPENYKVDTAQKVILALILSVVEIYCIMASGEHKTIDTGWYIAHAPNIRRAWAYLFIFASSLIAGPIIGRFPFKVGLKFAFYYTLAKFVSYMAISWIFLGSAAI